MKRPKPKQWWQTPFIKGWYPLDTIVSSPEGQKKTRDEIAGLVSVLGLAKGSGVLDLACGTGRHALALAKRKMQVTGIDISPAYLKTARRAARAQKLDVDFIEQDIRTTAYIEKFDAVINLFSSFGYFDDAGDDLKVAKAAFDGLKPNGALVIETMNVEWLKLNFSTQSWVELGDGSFVLESRRLDAKKSTAFAYWIFLKGNQRREMHSIIRMYNKARFSKLLKAAGFSKIRFYGNLMGAAYLPRQSNRIVAVATKGTL